MNLIDKPKIVTLKRNAPPLSELYEDFCKQYGSILPITPFRLENIKINIFYPFEVNHPEMIYLYFFDGISGKFCGLPKSLIMKTPRVRKDKKVKLIEILDTETWDSTPEMFLVSQIGIYAVGLTEDFTCSISIERKFTYQIISKKLFKEFWFADGKQHHQVGDNFPYENGRIELTVNEIDEHYGIAFCSAIGFI